MGQIKVNSPHPPISCDIFFLLSEMKRYLIFLKVDKNGYAQHLDVCGRLCIEKQTFVDNCNPLHYAQTRGVKGKIKGFLSPNSAPHSKSITVHSIHSIHSPYIHKHSPYIHLRFTLFHV